MSAYDAGYYCTDNRANPFHYHRQRVFYNAWKKGRDDRAADDAA